MGRSSSAPAGFSSVSVPGLLGGLLLGGQLLGVCLLTSACEEKAQTPEASVSAAPSGALPGGAQKLATLTEEQKRSVLAKVGERTITLGEYAETLERMDPFERIRYQSPERRKALLDQMIDVELLAQEARRRGLDKQPETQLRLSQALRDEVLNELRKKLPDPAAIPEAEVRAYYDAHRAELREPERRRVLHIAVGSLELAKKIAEESQGASGEKWAELAAKHSVDRRGTGKNEAVELAGDLGLVSAPGSERGDNPLIAEPLRKAVFGLDKLGDVTREPVAAEGLYHVVRHGGVSAARDRSYQDAERLIRVELVRQKLAEKEAELDKELRQRFPVQIDEAAVKRLKPEKPAPPVAPPAPAPLPSAPAAPPAPSAAPQKTP